VASTPPLAAHRARARQVNGWKVVTTSNMAVIFFIFGVTLDTSELLTALKAWRALAFGLLSMLVLTPLFGFAAVRLPFRPPEFALGLAIMACVPSSLSSGVTLVIQARCWGPGRRGGAAACGAQAGPGVRCSS
jgi:sodium/bile acid cotransporter 7